MFKCTCTKTFINRKIVFLILSMLCFSNLLVGQNTSIRKKTITGRILDTITKKSIVDVIVVNKNTNKTTLSDNDGYFSIAADLQDTLILYLIGYHPKQYHFASPEEYNKQVQLFFLKPNIEELRQVEITAKRKKEVQHPFNQVPATVQSPISFLYERYSKKYKQYRKIEELEKEKYYKHLRESRFNKQLVMDVTDISSDEVDEFMKQCKFSDDFLLNASDYDFIVAIQRKYRYYSEKR